jgi:hypothetical protein
MMKRAHIGRRHAMHPTGMSCELPACQIKLTLLAPDIVQAILDGRQPEALGLPVLLKPFPLEWERQHRHFGCEARGTNTLFDTAATLSEGQPRRDADR